MVLSAVCTGTTSILRIGNSGVTVTIKSSWCRNSSGAANFGAVEWLEVSTKACKIVVGARAVVEGGGMVCSGPEPLGAECLVGFIGAEA